ncbi:hypothetical protein V493_07522 [Pseudogymnoascus sp. VKM F-4281 (FW-2241)]|nr:hypothetical protein V493_07522 [Pseudogymnoascus sp. VKM F-4281 (FW-2241)]
MGISGLLPLLKSIHKPCNLKKFAGQTIGVDAYGWLHRGTISCTMDLVMGKPTRKFVDFAMHRVRMLQHFGVIPFLIFDGDYLPSKAATEADRMKRRAASKTLGLELLNAGKIAQANLELQKAVDVTPEMARQLIDELNMAGVQYIVAPYEADAQMVYLERKGILDGILSEDSDLLVFGAMCLLTKLDQYGNCIEINQADFSACRDINLAGWSEKEFRQMAILSGCDYLSSITNMGLKTSYRMIRKHKTVEKVIRMLQFDGKYHVPKDYLDNFYQAELTFLHQRVFCPIANKVVFHTEPEQPIDDEKLTFIGAPVEAEIARKVATGELNPMTKEAIVARQRVPAESPRTPWMAKSQLRTAVSSQDLKKGVSIDQFFKPRRVPLAELDINCFTPSPSQQNALLRNPGPWEATPVPRPQLGRSTTQPEPQLPPPRSAPPRSQTSRTLSASFSSEPRPHKRPRLCSDSILDDTPTGALKLDRSRFFESTSDLSPSVGRTAKSRKSESDVYIYSDDSIEEAMLSLPDFDGFKHDSGKKMKVFNEDSKISDETNPTTDPTLQTSTETSFTSMPSLTQGTSFASTIDDPPTPVSTAPTATPISLKSRFAFTPKSQFSTLSRRSSDVVTPPTSAKPSRIPVSVKSQTRSASTPLQTLGSKALNRASSATSLPTPPYTPISTPTGTRNISSFTRQPKPKPAGLGGLPFPELARGMVRKQSSLKIVTEPADIPLPGHDEEEILALASPPKENKCKAFGSEDLIVHDSEEEELLSPDERVNLGRFAFGAT